MTTKTPDHGPEFLRAQLKTLPSAPGVYRMLNAKGEVLYVGKAKHLKKRVSAYTQLSKLPARLQRMVSATHALEITTTATEAEALLLEANLIKHHAPRYNILLKDDKSFPYIAIDDTHAFPRISKYRGAQHKGHSYFGPFASAGDVNRALAAIQKAFLIRPCSDNVFANRTRPCMEYQIKRCSAPCVGRISESDYAALLADAKAFLSGKSQRIQDTLAAQMEEASAALDYERAASLRDRLRALAHIQARQHINAPQLKDADIIGLFSKGDQVCIQVFFVRAGHTLGNRAFFPVHTEEHTPEVIMEAFLGRFYHTHTPPQQLLLSHPIYGQNIMEEALSSVAKKPVTIHLPQRGEKRRLIEMVCRNAEEALQRKQQEIASEHSLLKGVEEAFGLDSTPERIEVYDNSHIMGSHPVGAMVVAGTEGFLKNAYRRFTVDAGSRTGGDDYAMLREVFTRRFGRLQREDPDRERGWPDLVLIDGGPGHMRAAQDVFADLGISDLPFVCIAKGPDRNAGREKFYMPDRPAFSLAKNDPVLYYLQRLRDEAHRFAIFSHRSKRSRAIQRSELDSIPGIGPTRKKALLNYYGSVAAIKQAGLEDLEKVPGISKQIARTIFSHLHVES